MDFRPRHRAPLDTRSQTVLYAAECALLLTTMPICRRLPTILPACCGRPDSPPEPAMSPALYSALAEFYPLSRSAPLPYSRSMGATPEDSALMLRYSDGDVAAFEILYRRHNDALYRYLLRLSLNQHAAEDIFQEVWSRIIRSRHNYRPTAKFSTFLYRVAHNCFIDHVRRNKRHRSNLQIDPDRTADPADEPDVNTEKALARRRLDQALAILPDEQRDVFLLYEEAGFSIDVIAQVTGVNRETAKSRLRYAVKKLKAAIAESAGQREIAN